MGIPEGLEHLGRGGVTWEMGGPSPFQLQADDLGVLGDSDIHLCRPGEVMLALIMFVLGLTRVPCIGIRRSRHYHRIKLRIYFRTVNYLLSGQILFTIYHIQWHIWDIKCSAKVHMRPPGPACVCVGSGWHWVHYPLAPPANRLHLMTCLSSRHDSYYLSYTHDWLRKFCSSPKPKRMHWNKEANEA